MNYDVFSFLDILYKVLYPYTAQDESQINLDLGDIVTLIEKRGNGWWKGKIKDKEGWFPGSYVEEAEIGLGKLVTVLANVLMSFNGGIIVYS